MTVSLPKDVTGSAKERTFTGWANDISDRMKDILEFMTDKAKLACETMAKQADRNGSDVTYGVGNMVRLSSRNKMTKRPFRKLNNKKLGPYRVLAKVGHSYKLDLPSSIRIENVFHPSRLRLAATDPLPGQANAPLPPVVVNVRNEMLVIRSRGQFY